MRHRLQRQNARRNFRNRNISVTSISSIIIDDYRTPPPAYNMVFKNPVFAGDDDDKLPSYEETIQDNGNNRSTEGDLIENRRF